MASSQKAANDNSNLLDPIIMSQIKINIFQGNE